MKSLEAPEASKTSTLKKVPFSDSLLIVDIFVKNHYPKLDTINISMKEFEKGTFEKRTFRTLNLH